MYCNSKISHLVTVSIILSVIVFASCRKDLKLSDVKGEKKVVLLGELVAGDTFYLRAGQSVALTNSSELRFSILQNLAITLKDATGSYIPLNGYEDSFSTRLYTIPYSASKKVLGNSSYTVTAVHPSLGNASVSVTIPAQIDAQVMDTTTTIYSTDTTLRVRIQIKDPGNVPNYYVIEAVKQKMKVSGSFYYNNVWMSIDEERDLYEELKASGSLITHFDTVYYNSYLRQATYTADINSENVLDNGSFTRSRRILLKDTKFNGTSYQTDVYVVKSSSGTDYDQSKGRIIVYIKSVSADYYKFLKGYETYDPSTGYTSLQQPVKVEGNITNGLGVIGGVSQVKFIYMTDLWDF